MPDSSKECQGRSLIQIDQPLTEDEAVIDSEPSGRDLIQSYQERIAKLELKVKQQSSAFDMMMMATNKNDFKTFFALVLHNDRREDAEKWVCWFDKQHGTQLDIMWDQLELGEASIPFYWSAWFPRLMKMCQVWHFLMFPDCNRYNQKQDQSRSGADCMNTEGTTTSPPCKACKVPDCEPICASAPFHEMAEKLKVNVNQRRIEIKGSPIQAHCWICHRNFAGIYADDQRGACQWSHYDKWGTLQVEVQGNCKTCIAMEQDVTAR